MIVLKYLLFFVIIFCLFVSKSFDLSLISCIVISCRRYILIIYKQNTLSFLLLFLFFCFFLYYRKKAKLNKNIKIKSHSSQIYFPSFLFIFLCHIYIFFFQFIFYCIHSYFVFCLLLFFINFLLFLANFLVYFVTKKKPQAFAYQPDSRCLNTYTIFNRIGVETDNRAEWHTPRMWNANLVWKIDDTLIALFAIKVYKSTTTTNVW